MKLKVAWYSFFPIESLPHLPAELRGIPRLHPATWQRVLWDELKACPNLELHVLVVRKHFPRALSFELDGTRFHCIRAWPGLRGPSLYWLDTMLIRRVLARVQPHVTHAWGSEFGAAAVAARLRWPALVTMQGILTWLETVFPLNRHLKVSRLLEPGSLRRARFVSCESSFAMNYLRQRYPHLRLTQIEHAPAPLFATARRTPRLQPPRILCVGSFVFEKGADVAIRALDALSRQRRFELRWVGPRNAALEKRLRAETGGELWARTTFAGDLPSESVAAELSQAAVLLHASRADNSPNSVKEAVVAGVPVIATNTGGIPDYVFHGKNGLLFASGDVDACRARLEEALSHPLFSRGEVDGQALRRTREYLSSATMAEKFLRAYETVWKASCA